MTTGQAIVVGLLQGCAVVWLMLSILWGMASYDPDPRERPRLWPWIALAFPAVLLWLIAMVVYSLLMALITAPGELPGVLRDIRRDWQKRRRRRY